MRTPNLFIVGEPKSGTTSLYYHLKDHPEIFMSEVKEPKFFCTDFIQECKQHESRFFKKNYVPFSTPDAYADLFRTWTTESYGGEASTSYLRSSVAAQNIHAANPDAKIIIMVREPVDMLHSLHSQYLVTRNETIEDFEDALQAETDRREGKRIPRISYLPPSFFHYSEWVKFAEHIKRFTNLFPQKNIKIILHDDFKKNTADIYKDVLQFLGVDSDFKPDFAHKNVNKKIRSMPVRILIDFVRKYNVPKMIIPKKLYRRLGKKVYRLATVEQQRKPLPEELRRALMKKYKPDVEKLGALLGRDVVTLWGYDRLE